MNLRIGKTKIRGSRKVERKGGGGRDWKGNRRFISFIM